jgi:NADH-quinone oxidoreductase subunit M
MESLLSYIIFTPILTALILGAFRANLSILKVGAILSSAVVFALVTLLVLNFDPDAMMQFSKTLPWISSAGFSYHVGVDTLSLVLLTLITFFMPLLYIYMKN